MICRLFALYMFATRKDGCCHEEDGQVSHLIPLFLLWKRTASGQAFDRWPENGLYL